MINRGVVMVRPAQPYLDWAEKLDDSIVPDPSDECNVYLIPSFEDDSDAWQYLTEVKIWEWIFENELFEWHTEKNAWPKWRTFSKFKKWFHVEFHSTVLDLCDYAFAEEE